MNKMLLIALFSTLLALVGCNKGYSDTLKSSDAPVTNTDVTATVTGGVFQFSDKKPVSASKVSLKFLKTGHTIETTSDKNGLFSFINLTDRGTFIVSASSGNSVGSKQGSVLDTALDASVIVKVSEPGDGQMTGSVIFDNGTPVVNALITVIFPDSGKSASTATNAQGEYSLTGLNTDGSVIIIAFDSISGASDNNSTFLAPDHPSATVNFTLDSQITANQGLLNAGFKSGTKGWETKGDVKIIDSSQAFDSPN